MVYLNALFVKKLNVYKGNMWKDFLWKFVVDNAWLSFVAYFDKRNMSICKEITKRLLALHSKTLTHLSLSVHFAIPKKQHRHLIWYLKLLDSWQSKFCRPKHERNSDSVLLRLREFKAPNTSKKPSGQVTNLTVGKRICRYCNSHRNAPEFLKTMSHQGDICNEKHLWKDLESTLRYLKVIDLRSPAL